MAPQGFDVAFVIFTSVLTTSVARLHVRAKMFKAGTTFNVHYTAFPTYIFISYLCQYHQFERKSRLYNRSPRFVGAATQAKILMIEPPLY